MGARGIRPCVSWQSQAAPTRDQFQLLARLGSSHCHEYRLVLGTFLGDSCSLGLLSGDHDQRSNGTGRIQDPFLSVFSSLYHVTPRCKLPSGLEKLAREICISLSVSEVQFLLLFYLFWIWPLPDDSFCQCSVELLIFFLAVWTALCGFH